MSLITLSVPLFMAHSSQFSTLACLSSSAQREPGCELHREEENISVRVCVCVPCVGAGSDGGRVEIIFSVSGCPEAAPVREEMPEYDPCSSIYLRPSTSTHRRRAIEGPDVRIIRQRRGRRPAGSEEVIGTITASRGKAWQKDLATCRGGSFGKRRPSLHSWLAVVEISHAEHERDATKGFPR